ncbi:MAG TPA: hypothetical protein VKE40_08160 [Gemmataceae bacterium]|nr:hypothetical protein [Gemmataceae bacterium]
MARTPVLLLLVTVICGIAEGSGPVKAQVYREQLLDALDEIELGMPEELASAKIGQPVATSGDGCSAPDWRWYKFAEWFAGDYRIEVRFRHGRVITKLYHPYKD